MSQMLEGPRKTFLAGETAGPHLRWYISDASTSPPTVSIAGAANPSIGVNEAAVIATGPVALLLANAQGTRKMVTAGAITGGNKVYAAADGEIASSGTLLEGLAFETVTTDQDILEVMGAFGEDVDEDWADDELAEYGTGDDAVMGWLTGDADNHAFVIGLGDLNGALHITDKAARATDWNLSADAATTTVYVHSNTTPATDYISIGGHDGTTATINVGGGTTLNIDIAGTTEAIFTAALTTLPGYVIAVEAVANTAGVGITGTADNYVTSVEKMGTIIKTTILIEVDGLNSGGSANDVVGADGAGVAHLGQITAAVNGTIFAGKITCLETPTGGDPDIDLWYTDDATGVEDTLVTAMSNQVQCINHGDWTGAEIDVLTAFPPATKYLYLTTGAATDATYTAGILLIELFGVAP